MIKIIIAFILISISAHAQFTPRYTHSYLSDGSGNEITSHSDSDSQGIDAHITNSVPVTGSFPTPPPSQAVTGPATDAQMRASPIPIQINNSSISVTGSFPTPPPSQAVTGSFPTPPPSQAVTGPLTDTQIRASPVPVQINNSSIAVTGSFPTPPPSQAVTGSFPTPPASQAVTGSFPTPPPSQAVTGPVTDTQLRASPVPVQINNTSAFPTPPASQAVTGSFPTPPPSQAVTGSFPTPPPTQAITLAASSISGSNPCVNPTSTLTSIAGATSTTNATQIIALSGSTVIYLCSAAIIGVSGTSPTFSLVYGTGSNCVTGQTTLMQAFGTTANQLYQFANPVAVAPSGKAVCYKDGGTSPVQNYQITYVQQ